MKYFIAKSPDGIRIGCVKDADAEATELREDFAGWCDDPEQEIPEEFAEDFTPEQPTNTEQYFLVEIKEEMAGTNTFGIDDVELGTVEYMVRGNNVIDVLEQVSKKLTNPQSSELQISIRYFGGKQNVLN